MPFKDLTSNIFVCETSSSGTLNLKAECMIAGYTDYYIFFIVNLIILVVTAILALFAIISLVFLKMRHSAAYFLNFLANSTVMFSEVAIESGEVDEGDVAPSDSGSED